MPLLLVAALVLAAPASAAWQAPVDGAVLAPFAYDRAQPFAPGARRGADLRTARGAAVRAPCGGVVTFAGRVPRFGGAVTIRCGRLAATVLGLRSPAVRRGTTVLPGRPLGAARGGVVRLGARRAADRFGYRDPVPLIRSLPPRGPVPLGPAPRPRPPRPVTPPRPRPAPPPLRPAAHPAVPLAVWLGLALAATSLGAGVTVRARRSARPAGRVRRAAE